MLISVTLFEFNATFHHSTYVRQYIVFQNQLDTWVIINTCSIHEKKRYENLVCKRSAMLSKADDIEKSLFYNAVQFA